VVDAVNCAVEIQRDLAERNAELPYNRQMQFRIGVNLGDVIEEEGRIYGDGINIAARVESLSAAGGICISGRAYDQVANKLGLEYENLGEHQVKNISTPIRVYRVLSYPGAAAHRVVQAKETLGRRWRKIVISAAVVVVVVGMLGIWQFYIRSPAIEPASVGKMAFPLPDKPSIAVLPFNNMSDDPKQEYFSDGMTEDLITDLSKISGLFVIARNSVFTYKGKPVKIGQVAEDLGVRYVLEGSVRRSGDQIRINAQLIDATTGGHLWADRYDGKMDNIFALQDDITKKIVAALEVKLTDKEETQKNGKETDNLEAYDAFLQGWNYYRRNTPKDWANAISRFEKAIELDPDYCRAHAAIALIYWRHTRTSRFELRDPELGITYEEAIMRACEYLQLSSRKPTSIYYRVEASMALYRRQYEKAISATEHAIDLDPNDIDGIYNMAFILMAAGKLDRAVDLIKKGMRLDPHNIGQPLYLLGMAHFARGQLKKAVSMIERALAHNPKLPRPAPILPAALALLDQESEAQTALEDFRTSRPYYFNFRSIMFYFPFQDPVVLDRLANGIRKAGLLAPKFTYYKFLPEYMLDEAEIGELLFGRKVEIARYQRGDSNLIERTGDGKAIIRPAWETHGDILDSSQSRIEDGMICDQWKTSTSG
jgi:TolB-like protein/Flp pilus assembly protein TadD